MSRCVGRVGIGRLGLLLCLGVEKMVVAEKGSLLNILSVTKLQGGSCENRLDIVFRP